MDTNQEIRAAALNAASNLTNETLTQIVIAEEFFVPWITTGQYPDSLIPKLDEHRAMLSRKWNVAPLGAPHPPTSEPEPLPVLEVDAWETEPKKKPAKKKKPATPPSPIARLVENVTSTFSSSDNDASSRPSTDPTDE